MDRYAASPQDAPSRGMTPAVAPQRLIAPQHRGAALGRSRAEALHIDVAMAAGRRPSLHIAVSGRGDWAYAEVLDGADPRKAAAFALRAVERSRRRSFSIRRLICDNASGWHARSFTARCREIGLRVERAEPLDPWTNARAERFMRFALAGWAVDADVGDASEWTRIRSRWVQLENQRMSRRSTAAAADRRAGRSSSEASNALNVEQ